MWRLCLCHNNDTLLLQESLKAFLREYPEIFYESYNEDIYSEKKKLRSIKSAFAARATPFCGLYNQHSIIKGFYSEVNECTEKAIKDYISTHFKRNPVEILSTEESEDNFSMLIKQFNKK